LSRGSFGEVRVMEFRHILFFERYVRRTYANLTFCILAYAYPQAVVAVAEYDL